MCGELQRSPSRHGVSVIRRAQIGAHHGAARCCNHNTHYVAGYVSEERKHDALVSAPPPRGKSTHGGSWRRDEWCCVNLGGPSRTARRKDCRRASVDRIENRKSVVRVAAPHRKSSPAGSGKL